MLNCIHESLLLSVLRTICLRISETSSTSLEEQWQIVQSKLWETNYNWIDSLIQTNIQSSNALEVKRLLYVLDNWPDISCNLLTASLGAISPDLYWVEKILRELLFFNQADISNNKVVFYELLRDFTDYVYKRCNSDDLLELCIKLSFSDWDFSAEETIGLIEKWRTLLQEWEIGPFRSIAWVSLGALPTAGVWDSVPSERKLVLFDILLEAIQYLPEIWEIAPELAFNLAIQIHAGDDHCIPLILYYWLLTPFPQRERLLSNNNISEVAASYLPKFYWPSMEKPVKSKADFDEVWAQFQEINGIFQIIDDQRALLKRKTRGENPFIDLGDWSIYHQSSLQTIPVFDSLLRNPSADRLILQWTHELTHLFCLSGSLGIIDMAFKLVMDLTETTLVLISSKGEQLPFESDEFGHKFADVTNIDDVFMQPVTLVLLTQLANLVRKQKAFFAAWTPWLEGVAVYGELCDDPLLDKQYFNVVRAGLLDFLDLAKDSPFQGDGVAVVQKFHAEIENKHRQALEQSGVSQLEVYANTQNIPYWASYLMIRRLVARWRLRMQMPLSSTQAHQLILLATHHIPLWEGLPDFSQKAEHFEQACLDWVQQFMNILWDMPAEQLHNFYKQLSTSSHQLSPLYWENHRFVLRQSAGFNQSVNNCLKSICEQIKNPTASIPAQYLYNLLPSTNLMLNMGQSMRHGEGNSVDSALTDLKVQYSQLLIGEAEVFFWLHPGDNSVTCLVPIFDDPDGEGRAFMPFPLQLSTEDFERLRKEVAQKKKPLMHVKRVLSQYPATSQELLNKLPKHQLLFYYGDWSYNQVVGRFGILGRVDSAQMKDCMDHTLELFTPGTSWKRGGWYYAVQSLDRTRITLDNWLANVRQNGVRPPDPEVGWIIDEMWLLASLQIVDAAKENKFKELYQEALLSMDPLFLETGRLWENTTLNEQILLNFNQDRQKILDAFTQTAFKPQVNCPYLDEYNERLQAGGLHWFTKTNEGWDVAENANLGTNVRSTNL